MVLQRGMTKRLIQAKYNLIANLFPALPAVPPHISLQLNKVNIRRELSSLLESLHLIIISLWSDQINPVSPLPSDFPTLRISFGQPDNPQSCCLHKRSMLTPFFQEDTIYFKRSEETVTQVSINNWWQYFWCLAGWLWLLQPNKWIMPHLFTSWTSCAHPKFWDDVTWIKHNVD